MTVTREARYLSGADLGKTISIQYGEGELTGTLAAVEHGANLITEDRLCSTETTYTLGPARIRLEILTEDGLAQASVKPQHPVTITGQIGSNRIGDMEINEWLPSAAALFVGVFSVLVSNFFVDSREKRKARAERAQVMRNYAHALLEWHLYCFSNLGPGSGNHPAPSRDRLTECARQFYPYLHEFKGHREYGNLMSPYPEQFQGDPPWEESEFYQKACDAVEEHVKKYPKRPARNAYKRKRKAK